MIIKHLIDIPLFVAGDNSILREILNPLRENLNLRYSLAWARVKPGEKTLRHKLISSEVYYILYGTGIMHIDNNDQEVNKNDTIYIPPNTVQFIENTGDEFLDFLCIVDPAWRPENESVLTDKAAH